MKRITKRKIKIIKNRSKDLREWGFFALACATLIFAVLTFHLTLETNSKIKPDIEISLIDNHIFTPQDIANIYNITDGTQHLRKSNLNFRITNLGQTSAEYLNFYMKDESGEYGFNSNSIKELPKYKNDFFQIDFWNKNCSNILREILEQDKSFYEGSKECKDIRKNITSENKNFILRLDCPTCGFEQSDRCYSVHICINNYDDYCKKEDSKDYILKKISCPDNWWYD